MISLLFRILNFDFSAATVDEMPLATHFKVRDYWAFDLENSLVLFYNSLFDYHVGIGVVNLEQSTVVIGQSTMIFSGSFVLSKSRFFPKSYPANLKDGFIIEVAEDGRTDYFGVQLDEQNQLQATRINWLTNVNVVAVDGQFAYNLDWQPIDDETQQNGQYVELSKRSLETGELSSYPTINWKAKDVAFESGCRVGNQFFGCIDGDTWPPKSQIVLLNLDTLEWMETGIELNGGVYQMATDGEHTLIIEMLPKDRYEYYYRFVVNKPDSLSTCIWRNLQSIVHSRPDVYDFIRSKLPTNLSSPRPIENFVPLDTEL
ncbi:hypothetical protein M3Y94_00428300 [Aphelenchoides besseyi]|nr:hypothetical protein M3Y94_00428300 [Aphelenchoides besseyi]